MPIAPSPHGGPWLLLAQDRNGEVRRIEIDSQLRVGRSPSCEVLLRDAQVSRVHATLEPAAEGVWLTDHNSTNGTAVNGRRISGTAVLHDGDTLIIGTTRFKIVAPQKEDPLDPGATVVAPAYTEPVVVRQPARKRTCSYCRSENPATSRVCSRCGHAL